MSFERFIVERGGSGTKLPRLTKSGVLFLPRDVSTPYVDFKFYYIEFDKGARKVKIKFTDAHTRGCYMLKSKDGVIRCVLKKLLEGHFKMPSRTVKVDLTLHDQTSVIFDVPDIRKRDG